MNQPTTPGTELTLTISSMSYGGQGIARAQGDSGAKVWFVEGAVEGDVVRAVVCRDRGRYGEAKATATLTPSPWRQSPHCRYGEQCGGCDWQGIDAIRQSVWKEQFVKAALQRIGKLPDDVTTEFMAAPATHNYRNRILVRVHHEDGAPGLSLGYFRRGTHDLVAIQACTNAAQPINEALEKIQALDLRRLPAFRVRVELQSLPLIHPLAVVATVHAAETPVTTAEQFAAALRENDAVHWSGLSQDARNAPFLPFEDDLGVRFYTKPGQFQQVNMEMNRRLRRLVATLVAPAGAKRVLDVFCGSGNLSLPLAKGLERASPATAAEPPYVEGIEVNAVAIACAQHAAATQSLASTNYLAGDAEAHLWKCARGGESFDLILCDPPRQGMFKGMVPLKKLAPKDIIYVGCDPTTLARDIGYLCRGDTYSVKRVVGLDFFPNTYHVETLVHLRSSSS